MGARREPRVAPKMKSGVALRASGVYSIGRRKKGRACIGHVEYIAEDGRRVSEGSPARTPGAPHHTQAHLE